MQYAIAKVYIALIKELTAACCFYGYDKTMIKLLIAIALPLLMTTAII